MKIFLTIFLLLLILFARNLSLGPFNDPDYKTRETQLAEQQKAEALKKKQQEEQLKKFQERQLQLQALEKAEELKRKEQAAQALKQKRKQEERRRIRLMERQRIKAQIEENLRNAKLEEEQKKLYDARLRQKDSNSSSVTQNRQADDWNEFLVPQQTELTHYNPDDIETELANISRLRDILLRSDKTPESIKEYIRFLNYLSENYNIDIAFSYRGIVQTELDSRTTGAGGNYDMTLRYTPTESTQIALQIDGYNKTSQYNSSQFKDVFGALDSTSATYRQDAFYVTEVWVQKKFEDFIVRLGKIDSSSFFDTHMYKSNSRFFFNSTFSSNPYNAYPDNGLGAVVQYVQKNYYLSAEVSDANANYDKIDNTLFTEGEFYKAIEFGVTPKDGSKYHLTAWHKDEARIKKTPEAQGAIASFAQSLDHDLHLIIRAALSENAKAKRYASLGVGKRSLFLEHDVSGLAVGTLEPSKTQDRTQTVIESFYRIDPIPGMQISGDLQFIYHPSKGEQTWAVLPGLRLRLLF